jgi:hypothetical protein
LDDIRESACGNVEAVAVEVDGTATGLKIGDGIGHVAAFLVGRVCAPEKMRC